MYNTHIFTNTLTPIFKHIYKYRWYAIEVKKMKWRWRKKLYKKMRKKSNKNHIYRNLKHLSVIVTIRYVSCMALGKNIKCLSKSVYRWMYDVSFIYELYFLVLYEWIKWLLIYFHTYIYTLHLCMLEFYMKLCVCMQVCT